MSFFDDKTSMNTKGEVVVETDLELDEVEDARPASEAELATAEQRFEEVVHAAFPKGPQYPHAGNIAKKLKDHSGKGTPLAATIDSILVEYNKWRQATKAASGTKSEIIAAKVAALDAYSNFLDTEAVDEFDSRGALVSSTLEEFCYYLLLPIIEKYPNALVGKHDAYEGLYFTAANVNQLLKLPSVHLPVNTLDFIIGAELQGTVERGKSKKNYSIRLPAVAVECKGYLDRPRFIESQNMARAMKSSFPQCLYLLVAQTLKLDVKKIGVAPEVDGIYVWRRSQNIDRKKRRELNIPMEPLFVPAVEHFFDRVELHMGGTWQLADPFTNGILK